MSEIRIQKIDGQEFVPYKDYQKLKEELKGLVERNIELDKKYTIVLTENKKLKEKNDRLIQKAKETQERIDEWNELEDRKNPRGY